METRECGKIIALVKGLWAFCSYLCLCRRDVQRNTITCEVWHAKVANYDSQINLHVSSLARQCLETASIMKAAGQYSGGMSGDIY